MFVENLSVKYTGINGLNYTLIKPLIRKREEGSVHKIESISDCVTKIHINKERTETKHRKNTYNSQI